MLAFASLLASMDIVHLALVHAQHTVHRYHRLLSLERLDTHYQARIIRTWDSAITRAVMDTALVLPVLQVSWRQLKGVGYLADHLSMQELRTWALQLSCIQWN